MIGPSSWTSVARPQECKASKNLGCTPSARPAINGEAALSTHIKPILRLQQWNSSSQLPTMRKLTPCLARLNAICRPLGPAEMHLQSAWLFRGHASLWLNEPPHMRTSTLGLFCHHAGWPCGLQVPSYRVGQVRRTFVPRSLWTLDVRISEDGGVM